mgnify:CR=1 FL=1|tara:strand:- start:436 stop:945 length:510 start_codon:yes stop_codon:yes gene_type:complete
MVEQQMILREFQCLTKLDHPLIQEILEVFIDRNFIYFVSPFYSGGEIYDLMYNDNTSEESEEIQLEPVPEDLLKPLIFQTLKVMNYLKNNNILHRDLKPQNIMLESFYDKNSKSFIKIIDFGYSLNLNSLSTLPKDQVDLILNFIMGTFAYTAPELLEQKDNFQDQFKI